MILHCAPLLALCLTFSYFCCSILRSEFFTLGILHFIALLGLGLIDKQQPELSPLERYLDTVEVWGSSPHGPTISFNELAKLLKKLHL
jgi:hypothetical protein